MLVDDALDMRKFYGLVLSRAGARVFSTSSPLEARVLLHVLTPDVIVCDISMPKEDGIGFVESIRSCPSQRVKSIPAIAITAFSSPAHRIAALEAGFQAFLCKSEPTEKLIKAIVDALARPPSELQ